MHTPSSNPATGETEAIFPTMEARTSTPRSPRRTPSIASGSRRGSPEERAALVRKVAELHRERRDELASIIVREMGKPLAAALGEVDFAADITEYYADNWDKITGDTPIDILAEGTAVIRRSALGRAPRRHAVELPVLPGGPVRGAQHRARQPDPAEARVAVPRVIGRDRGDVPRRGLPRRRVPEPAMPRSSRWRRSSPIPASRASR